jgi:signal transduction histidine kinase
MIGKDVYGVLAFQSSRPRGSAFSLADMEFMRLMAQWIGSEFERERYTEQLKAYNEEIASKSYELAEARDEALEASRLKSEFLATMSHEIRTPLHSITGFIELLKKTSLDTTQREYVGIVAKSAENLLGIINDILDFSKIESGKLEIESVVFNPFREFEPTFELFIEKALAKNISLYTFIDPRLPESLLGDALRIKQVLINLLSNAIKFTPEGGNIFVDVIAAEEKDTSIDVFFSIRDTGIGIAPHKLQKIFESFTQADSSITRRYGGTGLGLSISKNLVSLMSGNLGVESVPGK